MLDELERGGQPVIVTRRGRPVAVLSAIDAEEFYDYVLAHSPEFVAGRKAAEERFPDCASRCVRRRSGVTV